MRKCRFWLSYTGQRGTLNQAAPSPGDAIHVGGWDAGVTVTPRPRARDEFDVYMTAGSHDEGRPVQLGTVKDTPDGPAWEPSAKPGKAPSAVRDREVIAAIPVHSNEDNPDPDEYICVLLAGFWPGGGARFAVVRAHRDDSGWATEDRIYDREMSQCAAVHEMVRLAGCERPAGKFETALRSLLTEEQLDAPVPALNGRTARRLLAGWSGWH